MKNYESTFEELLTESMASRRESLAGHPSSEELLGFRRGELSSEDSEEVLRHLGACADCTDQLLFYFDFPATSDGLFDRISAHFRLWPTAAARWLWPSDRPAWNLARGAACIAAVLALVVLPIRLYRANQVIAEMSAPQTSVEMFHVKRPVRGLEESSAGESFVLGPGDRFFAVSISVETGFEVRRVRILDQDRKEIWQSREPQLDPLGVQLRLGLSRYSLEPGEYVIEVSGLEDGAPVEPRRYRFRLEYL